MTMRVTMIQARMGESGSVLAAGSTYTVSDAFGAMLVGGRYATDTDGALTPPKTVRSVADEVAISGVVSGDGNLPSAAVATTTGTPGQIVKLSDGPDKGVCLVWSIPEGATAYAWCWQIYPLAAYL